MRLSFTCRRPLILVIQFDDVSPPECPQNPFPCTQALNESIREEDRICLNSNNPNLDIYNLPFVDAKHLTLLSIIFQHPLVTEDLFSLTDQLINKNRGKKQLIFPSGFLLCFSENAISLFHNRSSESSGLPAVTALELEIPSLTQIPSINDFQIYSDCF